MYSSRQEGIFKALDISLASCALLDYLLIHDYAQGVRGTESRVARCLGRSV